MATEKRLIEYDKVYEYAWNGVNGGAMEYEDFDAIINAIDAVPTVDAVEVVRCRDCKHFVAPQGVPVCGCFYGLGFPNKSGDDFCSYGERRADAQ